MNCSKIGERIAEMRKSRGLSQQELSIALNVSRETVAKWENGSRNLKIEHTVVLADYFNVTCDYILRGIKAENVAIYKKLGLEDKAIEMLKWLSEEYVEPQNLQEIKEKLYKINEFIKKVDAGILKEHPNRVTDDELKAYSEYLQSKVNKKNLSTVNLLLSSIDGVQILNCMANYFDINPDTQTIMKTEEKGTELVCDSDLLSGMYSQATIAKMQELREQYRAENMNK